MDNRHSIGSKIQKYRKLKDMTQDELSKQSGIYLSTIKKYESGERNPKPDQLQKIAEALGISVTVFLDYDIILMPHQIPRRYTLCGFQVDILPIKTKNPTSIHLFQLSWIFF